MKKTLVVAAGLAVLSTSAFASKARMQAMGARRNSWFFLHARHKKHLENATFNECKL